MQIINEAARLKKVIGQKKIKGTVGFVPTMGALHKGHLSLVRESIKSNPYTVVSVFVNPTQFNDPKDFERYPRNFDADFALLEQIGCDLVFAPSVEEMYPEPDTRLFDFGLLEKVMEGKHRPGHFNGVGQVVSKFFDIVEPTRAYFGLKDFQQLAVIKKLVRDLSYKIEIVPCPIVREEDGLAMSSRNMLLTPEKRQAAPFIYRILMDVAKMAPDFTPGKIKEKVSQAFSLNDELELEYFDLVDNEMLQPISGFNPEMSCTACIAVYAGEIRLIDNVQINL